MSNLSSNGAGINPRNAQSIIRALDGNTATGMCRCPVHNDETPSLHVDEKNGRVLFKCHANCSQDAVIRALQSRNLWPTGKKTVPQTKQPDDDYQRFRKALAILRAAADPKMERPIAYFKGRGINTVPSNAMLLPAEKSDKLTGKRFPALVLPVVKDDKLIGAHLTWLSRDGTKKLSTEHPRRMYGPIRGGYVQLGEPDPDQPLIIAEGVETALSASQLTGFPAIAALSATNMPAVTPPACTEVIIAADKDDAGIKAAEASKLKLIDLGRKGRIAIPNGHRDWNDALNCGADHADLRHSISGAELFEGSAAVRALTMAEFMNLDFPAREHLLRPWLPSGSINMIHAQRGSAKTYFALSVAYAVATGQSLMGWEAHERKQVRVLYTDGELPGGLLQKRLKELGPQSPNLMILAREQFNMKRKQMFDLGDATGREYLDGFIDQNKIDLIVLDSLSTLVRSGEENEAGPWAPIQDWLLQHRWLNRTILLVHHEGKSGRPRGSSKREDVLDTMVGLKKRDDLDGANDSAFEVRFTKSREFYGADAAPMIIRLSVASGTVGWRHESVRDSVRDQVEEMLEQGLKQSEIATELNLSPGRISQIAKEINLKR